MAKHLPASLKEPTIGTGSILQALTLWKMFQNSKACHLPQCQLTSAGGQMIWLLVAFVCWRQDHSFQRKANFL